jgi:hypothetical protein
VITTELVVAEVDVEEQRLKEAEEAEADVEESH